jgi:hypothetical protein
MFVLSFGFLLTAAVTGDKNAPPIEYEYVEDLREWVIVQRGGMMYWGHFDGAGNFLPDVGRRALPKDGVPVSGFPVARYSNFPVGGKNETVYEYRSGRLIQGILNNDGDFVPDLNAKISPFPEYKYHSRSLRIYNLPGRFRPKGEVKSSLWQKAMLERARRGVSIDKLDDVLGPKMAHALGRDGRIVAYYYTNHDIIVEVDENNVVTKAYIKDVTKK